MEPDEGSVRLGVNLVPAVFDQNRAALDPEETLAETLGGRGTVPTDQIEVEYRNQAMRLLCIAGLSGLPQISLPMATIEGLPLGLSLIGARGSDRALIALARRVLA